MNWKMPPCGAVPRQSNSAELLEVRSQGLSEAGLGDVKPVNPGMGRLAGDTSRRRLRTMNEAATVLVPVAKKSYRKRDGKAGTVLSDPDHVLEKIPPVDCIAVCTAPTVVESNCPVKMYVNNAGVKTPVVSITVPWRVIETETLSSTCVKINGPTQTVVALGAQDCKTRSSALKLNCGKVVIDRKLLMLTGTPGCAVVKFANDPVSTRSLIAPGTGGPGGLEGMDAKVPVPPDARKSPIPNAAFAGQVTPLVGVPGLVGHQSIKCTVLDPFANVITPAATVPKAPSIGMAPALVENAKAIASAVAA